jgi:hypothetical protein
MRREIRFQAAPPRALKRPRASAAARSRSGGRSRSGARVLAGVLVRVGLWLLFCAVSVAAMDLWAVVHAQDIALHQAQEDLKQSLVSAQGGLGADSSQLTLAQVHAAQARAEATAAMKRLDSDMVLGTLRRFSIVRQQLDGVRQLEALTTKSADAAQRGEALLQGLQDARHAPGHASTIDVAGRYFIAHEKEIDAVAAEVLSIPAEVKAVDREHLVGPVRQAYAKLDTPMAQVSAAAPDVNMALSALPVVLGRDHPARYLILFADNAEMRAGGGFIGTYGVVSFNKGAYQKPDIRTTTQLEDPLLKVRAFRAGGKYYVPRSPAFLQAFPDKVGISQYLRNVTVSPQWPDDARLAEQLFANESGQTVDGVIQVDPSAVVHLLKAVGPVTVREPGSPPVEVRARDALDVLVGATRGKTKPFLGYFQQALLDKIEALPPAQYGLLERALSDSSQERHLLFYANSEQVQAVVNRYGLDRPLPPPTADSLLPVYVNFGADKADLYTTRQLTVHVDAQGNHHVEITFANHSPGKFKDPYTVFREQVLFYLPPSASGVKAKGFLRSRSIAVLPRFNPGPLDAGMDQGWHVYQGWVNLETGQSGTVSLDYKGAVPGAEPAFALVKQPGSGDWPVTVRVDGAGYRPGPGGVADPTGVTWKVVLTIDQVLRASR